MTERERALAILRRVEREGSYASMLLAAETGFVRALVLGVLRWRARLDDAIATYAKRRPAQIEPAVLDILRLGVYQVLFMDVPKYAAVSETVGLTGKPLARARGFVNAVLRRATERVPPEPADPAVRLSHPAWLLARWRSTYGEARAIAIADANQQLSHPDVLLLSGDPPEHSEPSAFVHGVYRVQGSTADLDRERMYPMDEGSAVVASIASAASSEVLDVSAAPGGKSLFMRSRGTQVVSSDISITRLLPLLRRGGPIVVADGRRPPLRRRVRAVLLDAPCSATGTIRKNPELKWRLREESIREFAALQRELLLSAMDVAEETIVYSTCSLEREENDDVIAHALSLGSFELIDPRPFAPDAVHPWIDGNVVRLTPESGTDGFTIFVLQRR